ncbi:hypothetical protein RJ640_004964 [Escallonia rubra]|uniref:Peptidase A1 domain-containing protein n=1 Tax=Escallonia rubra TaxID=112253 RepID=A0AA88QJN9_9ASTE|nr:hypothetical protein RJ640_004964 [Escallonia rubra]
MAAKKAPRMATRLIHRDSILSPFYIASATLSDRATQAIQRDKARLAYLKAATTGYSLDDIRSGIVRNEFDTVFYANISIGQPPVPQLVVMDTGSSLFWIQCLPCVGTCGSAGNPTALYDPSKSSSYSPYPCPCAGLGSCDVSNQCQYSVAYGGGTESRGNYTREELTFVTQDEKPTTISNVLFGCGHEIERLNGQTRGVHGLGPRPPSVAKYLAPSSHTASETLASVSAGDKKLDIDPQIFQRSQEGRGGVIIDSGMTLTVLAGGAFEPLASEVQNIINGLNLERAWSWELPLHKPVHKQNETKAIIVYSNTMEKTSTNSYLFVSTKLVEKRDSVEDEQIGQ